MDVHRKVGLVLTRACSALVVFALLHLGAVARADRPEAGSAQTLKLPTGPSSLKGLGESFEVSESTGTGSFALPLMLAPAALAPRLSLHYAAGSGKSELGLSFRLPLLTVYRMTDKGAPRFAESDRFAVRGEGLNDELVLVDETRRLYRLKNEGAFALFERDAATDSWRIRLPKGETLYLGEQQSARQTSLGRSHAWYVTREADRFGHEIRYRYFKEQGQHGRVYLEEIAYQLHAAEPYRNYVTLAYESRPDVFMDASSGEPIVTSLRVRDIVMRQGSRTLRTYHLRYGEDSMLSTLVEVELEGEGGERMPSLSLSYLSRSSSSGQFVQMQRLPPLESLVRGDAVLEDVTGDGLPDLLVGLSGNYHYYENLDGVRWAQAATPLVGPKPDRNLSESDVVLADVDGDGQRDVVHSHQGAFRYYPAGRTVEGRFLGFEAPRPLLSNEQGFHFGSAHVKLTDLNADGRTDLLAQKSGEDKQLVNVAGDELRAEWMPELPLDVDLTDARVEHVDFNGDGVLDFVRKEISYDRSRVRVWHGLGAGKFMPEQQMLGVPKADGTEFFLEDVNRDGQCDLVRISGTWAAYYLNDGHGTFLPKQGSYTGLPSRSQTVRLLFADMNGNATTDVVWLTTQGKLYYLDLAGEPFAGLLARVDNGMGLVTELAYRSSTEFAVDAKRAGQP